MGFFKRTKKEVENIPELPVEPVIKEDPRISEQENAIRENQVKIDELTSKLENVREEYNILVGTLMAVKKEHNEKKNALEIINQEYQRIKNQIEQSESKFQQAKIASENLIKAEKVLEEVKEEESKIKEEYEKIKLKISEAQSELHEIKNQQTQAQIELDEINSGIHNARAGFQNIPSEILTEDVFSKTEKEFIERELSGSKKSDSNNIIEAASAIVASLKSRLNSKELELIAIQQQLQKERDAHNETKNMLEQLMKQIKSNRQ